MSDWTVTGADDQPVIGNTHQPAGAARAVVLVAHGFKGYKDYGMFPRIATTLADAGCIAHRFNFSHSGMTNDVAAFARPDLFERDTWNRQVEDVVAVLAAIGDGRLPGAGLPVVLFGHSRGGVTVLLTAGRGRAAVAGVCTAAAPSTCLSLSPEDVERLERGGFLVSPSSRTGQELRVGRAFLDEQRADPDDHDLLALAARIECPVLVAHGTRDPTVPVDCASRIARAVGARASVLEIEGGDHVFNTPNPLGDDVPSSPQLQTLLDGVTAFVAKVAE